MATLKNILELAKRGSPKAIAVLMNRHLQPKGITAKAGLRDGCLQVLLESATIPEQSTLVAFIRKGVTGLGIESIKRVKVYGKQTGKEFPAWIQEFELVTQTVPISPLASSTPTKTRENIVVVQTKNPQLNQRTSVQGIKSTKSIQTPNREWLTSIKPSQIIIVLLLVFTSIIVIFLLIYPPVNLRNTYKKADCKTTYKIIFNMIIKERNRVSKFSFDQRDIENKIKSIDKLVAALESNYIQLKDEKLKLITERFITEAKAESASLHQIGIMKSESKIVVPSAETAPKNKYEFESKRAMQSLLNQFSLIKDAANYCASE